MNKKMMLLAIKIAVAILCFVFVVYKVRHLFLTHMKGSAVVERTFAMIKPDAVAAKNSGKIIDAIEQHGFTIVGMRKLHMSKETAQEFYAVHKERPFYGELVDFVASGPVIVMMLEKENAIKAWRDLMGATDPVKADVGTLRKQFGASIGSNAVHGSDAADTAQVELTIFFPDLV